jgi:fermentation-respiration switch protein FrsA (DUF1100 family)
MKFVSTWGLFLLVAVIAYLIIVVILYFLQEKLVFFPDRNLILTPNNSGLEYSEHRFKTDDQIMLHGWLIPARQKRGTLLFFHGNAGNISHRLESIRLFNQLDLDVFIVDYRGYGNSEGVVSEDGTYTDAVAAWNYLTQTLRVDPKQIIVFGRSLGGSIAACLATQVTPGIVILESSFTSMPDLGASIYPFFPVRIISRIQYPTSNFVTKIRSPILFIHSRDDEIIPFRNTEKNFELASEPKSILEIVGSHNEGFWISQEQYLTGIKHFLDTHMPIHHNSSGL